MLVKLCDLARKSSTEETVRRRVASCCTAFRFGARAAFLNLGNVCGVSFVGDTYDQKLSDSLLRRPISSAMAFEGVFGIPRDKSLSLNTML